MFLDLEKAYDMLWREGTLQALSEAGVSGQMYNYIKNFLQERTFQVRINGTLSEVFTQENGVPQGAVISPTLFNVLINRIGDLEKKYVNIKLGQFADDTAVWVKPEACPKKKITKRTVRTLNVMIGAPLEDLLGRMELLGFRVNISKTQCIFFNMKNKGELKINGSTIRSSSAIKYLGVELDSMLTFKNHIESLAKKGGKALNILQHICGKNWGLKNKHRILLYKNFVLPRMSYAEELIPEKTCAIRKLDVIQNKALRLITKMPKATPVKALTAITKIPPLSIRRKEKKLAFWARVTHNPGNPAREIYINQTSIDKDDMGIGPDTQQLITLLKLGNTEITKKIKLIDSWNMKGLVIDTSLKEHIKKQSDSKTDIKTTALNYINKAFGQTTQYVTDG